jgi:hypothetical protein
MKTKNNFTEKELEIFSDELLNDFQMMETYAGDVNNGCPGTNTDCGCINFFCGNDCKVKAWFNCGATPIPTDPK